MTSLAIPDKRLIYDVQNYTRYLQENGIAVSMSRLIEKFDSIWPLIAFRHFGFDTIPQYKPKIICASTNMINKVSHFPFPVRGRRAVYGIGKGCWDRLTTDFQERELYRSIEMRFLDGSPWEITPIYRTAVRSIERNKSAWYGCKTLGDVQQRCVYLERLYRSIRDDGYDAKLDKPWTHSIRGVSVPDIIRVAVGRDGELIRCVGGRNRLAIAKVLNIDSIPAILQIEHASWDGTFEIIQEVPIQSPVDGPASRLDNGCAEL